MEAQNDAAEQWEQMAVTELYREYRNVLRERKLELRPALIDLFDSETNWGDWQKSTRTIRMSRKLVLQHSWFAVTGILRHEMAHQLVDEGGGSARKEEGRIHGPAFQDACRQLGVPMEFSKAAANLRAHALDWRDEPVDPESERMLEKVRKLLALATSTNEHEALLAMNRVREIYAKYNLQKIESGAENNYVHIFIAQKSRRREIHVKKILGILVGHFFVKVIMTQSFDVRLGYYVPSFEIIGSRENALMAEYVYHFLLQQTELLLARIEAETGRKFSRVDRKSYKLGLLAGFSDKLQYDEFATKSRGGSQTSSRSGPQPHREPEGTSAAESIAKALIHRALKQFERDQQIEAYVDSVFPRLHSSRDSARNVSSHAFAAGHTQGKKISLQKPITARAKGSGKFLGPAAN